MIKVSVVLPVFNGAQTLSKTLESLCNQTYTDFELIACIDGSTDGSEMILKQYESKFKKLTILINPVNRGLGPTMNRLLSNTSGEFVAIAEQDDTYVPDRLKHQVVCLETNPNIGMVSGIAEFWDGTQVVSKFPGILVSGKQYPEGEAMFMLNYKQQIKVVNSCMMFRKQVHVDKGLYFTQHYPSISVDWTYVLRFALVSKIHGLHEVLVRLDRSENRNSVTSNKEQQFKASRELIRVMAYEYPKIISKETYRHAKRTQLALEWSSHYGLKFYVMGLWYVLIYMQDKRFKAKFVARLLKKMN